MNPIEILNKAREEAEHEFKLLWEDFWDGFIEDLVDKLAEEIGAEYHDDDPVELPSN